MKPIRGIILVSAFWTKILSLDKADAITIFPFVLLRRKMLRGDAKLINHERIHIRQALEMFVLPFYLWYSIEFLVRLVQYKDRHKAYLEISFEREAYTNQHNLSYLKKRRFWSFLNYLSS